MLATFVIGYSTWELVRMVRHRFIAKDAQTLGTLQICVASVAMLSSQSGYVFATLSPFAANGTAATGEFGDNLHSAWLSLTAVGAVCTSTPSR